MFMISTASHHDFLKQSPNQDVGLCLSMWRLGLVIGNCFRVHFKDA
jgi:hypothetical protein